MLICYKTTIMKKIIKCRALTLLILVIISKNKLRDREDGKYNYKIKITNKILIVGEKKHNKSHWNSLN